MELVATKKDKIILETKYSKIHSQVVVVIKNEIVCHSCKTYTTTCQYYLLLVCFILSKENENEHMIGCSCSEH